MLVSIVVDRRAKKARQIFLFMIFRKFYRLKISLIE